MPKKPRIWFAKRRYGYGSGAPITWQGWALLLAYLVVISAAPLVLPALVSLTITIAATAALIFTCIQTTEGGWSGRQR